MAAIRLLAGPLLRRSEPQRVCVWIAVSTPVRVKGVVFDADDLINEQRGLKRTRTISIGSGEAQSRKLGEKLHVALIEIRPRQELGVRAFPVGRTLAYDLELSRRGAPPGSGVALGVFFPREGPERISYGPHRLPTFVLRTRLPARFLHGSCRKPHGDDADALAIADALLAGTAGRAGDTGRFDSAGAVVQRPSFLVLTGDQIYADDVADPLIEHVAALGRELMGFDEEVPTARTTVPVGRLTCGARGRLVNALVRRDQQLFTSTEARNHLLSFGDFAAMYLLAWSPETWPREIPADSRCASLSASDSEQARYQRQRRALLDFRASLPRVRRVLANVATYMIFDDHEVTDDWNITRRWRDTVRDSPLGRRILTNALAAQWAFQAWGNAPDRFGEELVRTLEESLARRQQDIGALSSALDAVGGWSFFLPGSPCVLCLDERTQRAFDSDEGAPRRVSQAALETAVRGITERMAAGGLLVVAAPAPVIGVPLIEQLQEFLTWKNYKAALDKDLESWHANLAGFIAFLRAVAACRPAGCLLLSGDVHFAYVALADFRSQPHLDRPLHLAQFTSSALKNPSASLSPIGDPRTAALIDRVRGQARRKILFWETARPGWASASGDPVLGRPTPGERPPVTEVETNPEEAARLHPDHVLDVRYLGPMSGRDRIQVLAHSNLGEVVIHPDLTAALTLLEARHGALDDPTPHRFELHLAGGADQALPSTRAPQ